MRFSELEGAGIGVWGAGREIGSFADQLARRLPSARIVVAAFDARPAEGVGVALKAPQVRVVIGGEVGAEALVAALSGCDVVVRSPGVSVYRPELRAVRETGTPVTTATALWLAERGGEGVIGVTGTKGKSTTAALAAHLARAAGRTAHLAGNIGVPALDLLDCERADVTIVELSSYHTADLETGPQVALVTSLFREHTDWHGSEQAYRADKLRLLGLPGVRTAVINARDERLRGELPARVLPSLETIAYGVPDGWDVVPEGIALRGEPRAARAELPLRGEHNVLNLCGALTALEAISIQPSSLAQALSSFAPLPHRLEPVAERDGILWVNDSISTTPESTAAALASFAGREIVLIAGGQDRGQDFAELARALALRGASVIGVPSTGPRLTAAARESGVPGVDAVDARDMREAVALAGARARAGGVVLLSPAAPSYDHYRDFEERGECFRSLADRPTLSH